MITEQELKTMVTPETIKKLCELAEGFEKWENRESYDPKVWTSSDLVFPLLIHRTVEGWNNMQVNSENCIVIQDDSVVLWKENIDDCKTFDFKNYKPESLIQSECAMLDCLLNIFEGERK